MQVRIKRVYEEPDAHDGLRVLVDCLWPRGLSRSQANVDLRLRENAPSTELRKWLVTTQQNGPSSSDDIAPNSIAIQSK